VAITKQVALDENCDGTADGAFQESVTQDDNQCVVYRICVENTASDGTFTQDLLDVAVGDTHLGITGADFGDIPSGQNVCRIIPADVPAANCTTDPDSCVCTEVQGMNTAIVSSATCSATGADACLASGSDCDDTANVACLGCSVDIDKQVALDENCDQTADGPFSDSVTQDANECVIYRICVSNTGDQTLDASGVTVNDAHLGIVDLNFGQIAAGADPVCMDIPVEATAAECGGPTADPADDECLCTDVEGVNTAAISGAVCAVTGSNACDFAESDCQDTAQVACLTCEADIRKTVALDDNCDGTPDGAFQDSVTQNTGECVVYEICVFNNGEQTLNAAGVQVSDIHLGVVNHDFGTIPSGQSVCLQVPSQIPASACPGGQCLCETVEGTNTAVISAALCSDTGENACSFPASDCEDTAEVACEGEGCFTRTPGYWGTHPDVTSLFLPVTSCGIELNSSNEAVQDLCKETPTPQGYLNQQLQLMRQCAAAALNLAATEFFDGDCDGTVPFTNGGIEARIDFCCNTLCPSCSSDKSQIGSCISDLDFFNNFDDNELDETELCPNTLLGTAPPCDADPEACQLVGSDGIVIDHCGD
jgi:hypothetical protein